MSKGQVICFIVVFPALGVNCVANHDTSIVDNDYQYQNNHSCGAFFAGEGMDSKGFLIFAAVIPLKDGPEAGLSGAKQESSRIFLLGCLPQIHFDHGSRRELGQLPRGKPV
jgi:hypothetical protein